MRVEHWMTANPLTVEPHSSVVHARGLLKEHRINQLPVTLRGRLVGIVTDRDLRDAMATIRTLVEASDDPRARRRSPQEIMVDTVMTANAITIEPYDTMERAAVLMRRERIGALPVVHRGELRGILTRSDVLRAFLALASNERKRDIHRAWEEAAPSHVVAVGSAGRRARV
jgi:acetoin utilization protein AcuB